MRDKDLNRTVGIVSISKKSLRPAPTLCSWTAVVCREENHIRGERISIVFFRLKSVDAYRARGTWSVFKISSVMGLSLGTEG
ncbi:hypothetical protein PBY51_010455 [Eleginops maclovinus]|uniref:Uncharacterized protein n=1 Tax=Eleginops maclovinus TaxID=56733 RepID=A0AAN7XA86_ELEMC|nr:hypothetical protein PBY51_010455 [Eleginops maclovinus]